jgi:hypothetical protein
VSHGTSETAEKPTIEHTQRPAEHQQVARNKKKNTNLNCALRLWNVLYHTQLRSLFRVLLAMVLFSSSVFAKNNVFFDSLRNETTLLTTQNASYTRETRQRDHRGREYQVTCFVFH